MPGENPLTKEGLGRADAKGNDHSRLGKVLVDPIRHAGPSLIEAIVEDDDSALRQSAFAGGQIVRRDFSRMSAIDTDKTEWAAAKLQQMPGGQLHGISLMNNQTAHVRVPLQIPPETLKIARAGTIDVQVLLREQVDGHCQFIFGAEKIQEYKKFSMMYPDFGYTA